MCVDISEQQSGAGAGNGEPGTEGLLNARSVEGNYLRSSIT